MTFLRGNDGERQTQVTPQLTGPPHCPGIRSHIISHRKQSPLHVLLFFMVSFLFLNFPLRLRGLA